MIRTLILLLGLAALLGGCGRQGDLVRPAPMWGSPPPAESAEDTEAVDEDAPPEIDSPD